MPVGESLEEFLFLRGGVGDHDAELLRSGCEGAADGHRPPRRIAPIEVLDNPAIGQRQTRFILGTHDPNASRSPAHLKAASTSTRAGACITFAIGTAMRRASPGPRCLSPRRGCGTSAKPCENCSENECWDHIQVEITAAEKVENRVDNEGDAREHRNLTNALANNGDTFAYLTFRFG